jgi:hypothetical protein
MRRNARLLVLAATLAGCTEEFHMSTTNESTLTVKIGSLGGPCEGTHESVEDDGTVTLTKTIDIARGTCRVHVTFSATLLDMTEVRDEVAKRVVARGHVPERMTIKEFSEGSAFLIHDIVLSGVPSTTAAWRGNLLVDELPVATFSGRDLDSLARTTLTVPMTSELSRGVLRSYETDTDMQASGAIDLTDIPLAQWNALSPERMVTLELQITANLRVHAEYQI